MTLPTGYTSALSYAWGEEVVVHLSAPDLVSIDVVRFVDRPRDGAYDAATERVVSLGEVLPGAQSLPAGSFVDCGLVAEPIDTVTMCAWIWPTSQSRGAQPAIALVAGAVSVALVCCLERGAGLQAVDEDHLVSELWSDRPLRRRQWAFVAAGFERRGAAFVYATPAGASATPARASGSWPAPGVRFDRILLAGRPGSDPARCRLDGKLARPSLFAHALNAEALEAVKAGRGPRPLASWELGGDAATNRVAGRGSASNGVVQQRPTRAVTGPSWDGTAIAPAARPEHYDAIHFHRDDLDDSGWPSTASWTVPRGLDSGVCGIRIRAEGHDDVLPFALRRPSGPGPGIALLLPTFSYLAYANEHYMLDEARRAAIGLDLERALAAGWDYERRVTEVLRSAPLLSLYDLHADGSGTCYSSPLRPLLTVRGTHRKLSLGFGAPHQFSADLGLVGWLRRRGTAHDVITDHDLDRLGHEALERYHVLITGSHPEYWSAAMLDALEAFQARGGRVVYLGGNGLYWVTSRAHDSNTIEVRRGHCGTRNWTSEPGETTHSTTGEPGGIWRLRGRPPQQTVGVGFTAQGYLTAAPYRRLPAAADPRAAWLFAEVPDDAPIGTRGAILGAAAGYEIDRSDTNLGTPPHALRIATSAGGHGADYHCAVEETPELHHAIDGTRSKLVRADLVFFEGPQGGATFATGSIAWAGALDLASEDPAVSRITANVIDRFVKPDPFHVPEPGLTPQY